MSGICGSFGAHSKELVSRASRAMRGNSSHGREIHYFSAEIGLSAVEDSFLETIEVNGNQRVQVLLDGRLFNGNEIHITLGLDLPLPNSAPEVMGRLYALHGAKYFDRLEGSFALALWDGSVLTLLRDPFGVKTLFYGLLENDNTIIFASEMKAILQDERVPREVNIEALYEHKLFGFSLDDTTLVSSIKQVPPGHMLQASMAEDGCLCVTVSEYVQRSDTTMASMHEEEAVSALYVLLKRSIQNCMILDKNYKIGVLLSGGIDSGVLAAIAAQIDVNRLESYTVTDKPDFVDAVRASEVAQTLGINHEQVVVTFDEFMSELPNCIHCSESFITWAPFFFLIRAVRQEVRSAMSGEPAGPLISGGLEYVRSHNWRQKLTDLFLADMEVLPEQVVVSAKKTLQTLFGMENDQSLADYFMSHYLANRCFRGYGLHTAAMNVHLWYPYLDPSLIRFLAVLPPAFRTRGDRTKYILHKVSEKVGATPGRYAHGDDRMPKFGLPSSFTNLFRQLVILCESKIGNDVVARHPYRHFFTAKHMLFLFDLFYLIFIQHGGQAPSTIDIFDIYEDRGARHPLL